MASGLRHVGVLALVSALPAHTPPTINFWRRLFQLHGVLSSYDGTTTTMIDKETEAFHKVATVEQF
jgi:hypothetical protein